MDRLITFPFFNRMMFNSASPRLTFNHIKGERKEADWSVAKNLLKPKDGGKVKVLRQNGPFYKSLIKIS